MSKKLIVVADDFGFSEAYNYGVIKAYKEGVVCTQIGRASCRERV